MSHPGVEVITAFLAESGLVAGTVEEQRAVYAQLAEGAPPPEGVTVEPVTLGGRPAEWITPVSGGGEAVVLYLHGGGYCTGSLDSHRHLAARIAVASGCTAVTLDYRLAPEHRFPDAVTDATAAFGDLLALGVDPGRPGGGR